MNKIVKQYLLLFLEESQLGIFSETDINYISGCLLSSEERNSPIRDAWGNWEYPYTYHDYKEPYLDKYVLDILKREGIKQRTVWPGGKKFAINISHDVDFVSYNSVEHKIKRISKTMGGRKGPVSTLRYFRHMLPLHIKKSQGKETSDPLWIYERWLETLDKLSFKSTFFYFIRPEGASLNPYDCDYTFDEIIRFDGEYMTVSEMAKKMAQRDFEIGLHGSYYTFNNPELLRQQKEKLETEIGREIYATRQHWLHFDIHQTPETQSKAGLKIDGTMGFNRTIGFRNGTAFPFFLAGQSLEPLPVVEMPMHIMDGPLFTPNALELNEEHAIIRSLEIMDRVEEVGGCLSINFHPNYINDPVWWKVFNAIIKEARNRDAYCASYKFLYELVSKGQAKILREGNMMY